MNPRELFYLLFGDDSKEATGHPFLLRMDQLGAADNTTPVKTRTMVLRPPLRTYARIVWEAEQECTDHAQAWAALIKNPEQYLRITADRFIGTNPPFMTGPYPDTNVVPARGNTWKCNLFVGEICVRSGYRYRVYRDTASGLFFYKAPDPGFSKVPFTAPDGTTKPPIPGMSVVNDIRANNTFDPGGYVELRNSAGVRWGRRWDLKFTRMLDSGVSREAICDEITDVMMKIEGRCFTLVFARPGGDSGHTAILARVVKDEEHGLSPDWFNAERGLQFIKASKYEAVEFKAQLSVDKKTFPRCKNPDGTFKAGCELFMLECCPGRDPDTVAGLEDLYCAEGN